MDAAQRVHRARLGVAALSAALGLVCFAPVPGFGFAYDDQWTIVQNRALARPLSYLLQASLFGRAASRGIADSTRPAMVASTWIDHRLFGLHAAGYHVHSLILYALVCALAALALLALTRRPAIAVGGGAFFAVAPVHAEVVAAVNYREDLISGLGVLWLLVLLFSARNRRETTGDALVAAAIWLVALFAKESAVTLAALVAGVLAVRRPDAAWYSGRRKTLVALAVVVALWSMWRVSLRLHGVDDVPLAPRHALPAVLLATARYEVQALASSLAPFAWSPEYDAQGPATAIWIVPLSAALLALWLLARRRGTRPLALGLAVALIAPLSTSPIVGPANERADRYVFLAVLGGALVWGWLYDRALEALRARSGLRPRRVGGALLVPLTVPLVLAAQPATHAWRDDLALWSVASERAPGSFRSWVGLSRALRLQGDLDGAEAAVERAIALDPRSLSAHVTRAYVRLARGDVQGARSDIRSVRDLGGKHQKGLRRAEHCADLAPAEASRCILGDP